MGFTKLDSGIINSSIWSEPLATRVLWITLLSQCDEEGFVSTSLSGLKRSSNISQDEFDSALKTLLSPDNESRTRDNKGIRLIEVEGGFVVSNYKLYRDREYKEHRKEQVREAVRRYRDRNNELCNQPKITGDFKVLPSASASASSSESLKDKNIIPPTIEMISKYCADRKNNIDPQGFFDHYETRGWIPKGSTKKMRDWQAAVRTWEKNNFNKSKPETSSERIDRICQQRLSAQKNMSTPQ